MNDGPYTRCYKTEVFLHSLLLMNGDDNDDDDHNDNNNKLQASLAATHGGLGIRRACLYSVLCVCEGFRAHL